MQPVSSPKKYSLFKNLLFLIFFSGLTFLLLLIFVSFFEIKKIKVITNSAKDVKYLNDVFIGENIVFLNLKKIEKRLLELNPKFRNIKIEKKYPDTLQLRIELDSSIAKLVVDQGFFYLNKNGRILRKETNRKNNDLPVINFYQKLNYTSYAPGDYITYNELKTALLFIEALKGLELQVVNVDINGLNMIRLNLKTGVVLATTEKDIKVQIYQLEKIIKQFGIEGKEFETLDLRFDKPVVKIK